MVDDSAVWLKLYTSVLDHDGFEGLDDSARVLIVLLWAYAARCGRHVFPADPDWLRRRIPILNADPDLGPLLAAKDVYGNPTPFVRYCEAPGPEDEKKPVKKAAKKKTAKKTAKKTVKKTTKKASAKKERETDRERERERERKDEILTDFEREKQREKKERISTKQQSQRQRQTAEQAEKPENPKESDTGSGKKKESDAGSAEACHHIPKPTRSVLSRGPQRIGNIISGTFPKHWTDPDAEAFGWEIVEAILGVRKADRDDPVNRSNWGQFAKWWTDVKSRASPMLLGELRAKAIEKAVFVNSPKCKSARNKFAVWNKIMTGELVARCKAM